MYRIPETRSLSTFEDDLFFLVAMLTATPETEGLAGPVEEHLGRLTPVFEQRKTVHRAQLLAAAKARIADTNIDDCIRTLYSAALHEARMDCSAPSFSTLFASGLQEAIRHALERQVEVGRRIVEKLGLRLYDDAFRASHAPALTAALDAGKSAVEQRRATALKRAEVRLDEQAWKDEANAVRIGVYSQLLAIAGRARRDRSWAEAFFLGDPTRKGAPDEVLVDEEPAASREPAAPAGPPSP